MAKGNRKYYQMDYYYTQKNCRSYLDDLGGLASSMGRRLTKFIDLSNGKLEGREFKILLNRLGIYAGVFKYFGEIGDTLSNNIVSSNNNVCNVMGGHTELTDEYLTEVEDKVSTCNNLIYSAKSNLSALSGDALEKEKKLLEGYQSNLAELNAEKKLIEDLLDAVEAADGAGVSAVGDVTAKLTALNSKIMY